MSLDISFIGYGEVGSTFGRDLAEQKVGSVTAWDIRPERLEVARADGVRPAPSAAEAISGAAIVICAVTADVVEAVAQASAPWLAPGQIYLDVNSASPATKIRASAFVTARGADYVEGAVMAPVAGPRLAVPILGGGPGAARLADLLNPLGMAIRPVSTQTGRASAMKLCRSIMIKGIEALICDASRAAAAWQVEDEVYRSLAETFPGTDWARLAETMAERVGVHGLRRAAEMREAADMIAELDIDPALCLAVAQAQQRGAKT